MTRFCKYLLKKGRITEAQFTRAKSQINILNLKTGLCAYAFGFLDQPHIRKIMDIQNRTGQKFGEIAIALGYLTEGQLRTIIRIQDKYRVTVEEALVMDGALTCEELDAERQLFQVAADGQ